MASPAQVLPLAVRVTRLYRQSLKHSLSWAIDRQIWRREALLLRERFDLNKAETNEIKIRDLVEAGEAEFEAKRHPDPYIFPSAIDGSKYERNVPPPPGVLHMTPQEEAWFYGDAAPAAASSHQSHDH
ncbi:NADH dehydrogenase 1 beta subcomplex subunit 9 [Capsaspora owczarzaki ATCC 30864]|nr:NADH dehydrogenase 1 beta subcomplex subunit 9 [Capsaspora owczarzaki ATCC 30864]|eukprot:XP_004363349.1 NADH dehydrogenase 1 beta subcomplex subunit 9 [Capsaspora owczarzaki ATCC 30864]